MRSIFRVLSEGKNIKTREDRAVYRDMGRFARSHARDEQRLERQCLPSKSCEDFSHGRIVCTAMGRRGGLKASGAPRPVGLPQLA